MKIKIHKREILNERPWTIIYNNERKKAFYFPFFWKWEIWIIGDKQYPRDILPGSGTKDQFACLPIIGTPFKDDDEISKSMQDVIDNLDRILKDQYYTPDISELHVGFEYELFFENNWLPRIIDGTEMSNHINLPNGIIRVKFLDEENLLSLEWRTDIKEHMIYCQYKFKEFYLDYNIENKDCKISNLDNTLFNGTIKNKSELIKIMIMVGIKE